MSFVTGIDFYFLMQGAYLYFQLSTQFQKLQIIESYFWNRLKKTKFVFLSQC